MLVRALRAGAFLGVILLLPAFALFDPHEKRGVEQRRCENLARIKPLVVWSWQNDDDLNFINPDKTSVASYAGTISIDRESVYFRPRLNTLRVPAGTLIIPSLRLETRHSDKGLSDKAIDQIVHIITQTAAVQSSPVVQIDFDATENERSSYLSLLAKLRRSLPPETAISITSLASWCLADRWLVAGAADEEVAMLFSLGLGKGEVLSMLSSRPLSAPNNTEVAIGLSANEPKTNAQISADVIRRAKHVYLFASGGWTRARFEKISDEVLNRK